MSRVSRRLGPLVACALLMLAAGCGAASDPNVAAPDSAPDLYQALPPPSDPPAVSPTAAPPVSAAPTTSKRPTSTSDSARTREDDSRRGASAQGTSGGTAKIDWRPTGGDEFNDASVDTGAWKIYNSKGGFGNGLRRPEAISQSDGLLRITARGDVSGGMADQQGQLYGRWEFRARTDPGRGFGSAILLWPDSEKWPDDGELDIMEVPDQARTAAHFVVHWGARNNVHGTEVADDYTQWHTFALEWLPDRITWYVDGVKQYENTDKAAIPTKPMHLTIQLDQGPLKNWIDAPDETTPKEVSLEVDWVRIYAAP